jgi:hypothetical protein
MRKALAVGMVAASLSGCATFNNPITLNELGGLESAYGIALTAAVGYRRLYAVSPCHTGSISTLQNPCAQRSIVLALQKADRTAQQAIIAANTFVIKNPTLDASLVIATAQQALIGFQSIESAYNIH